MFNRREFNLAAIGAAIGAAASAGAGGLVFPARAGEIAPPKLGDNGLYEQEWFLQSFLELRDDLATADEEGKRFVIMWELKGCPYCKETHLVNLAKPEIRDYLIANFVIVQLDLAGSRMVTDFDGEALPEKAMARKWGVRFSPTIMFLPEGPEITPGKSAADLEVARIPGYFRPPHFLAMFRYVREKAYLKTNFRKYLRATLAG